MAPSRVSGMKMKNLLFGVILGLLAVVHSIPVNTVTQNPSEAEDDFFREAMTDGFLIDQSLPTLLTTESLPKKPTDDSSSSSSTTQIPQSGVTASSVTNETQTEESNFFDGSGDRDDTTATQISQFGFMSSLAGNEAHSTESYIIDGSGYTPIATTSQSVSHGQSSTYTVLEMDTKDSSSDSPTTQIPQSDFTSSFMLNEAQSTEIDVLYGSGSDKPATTERVSHVQSSPSALLARNFHGFTSDSFEFEGSGSTTTTTTTTTTIMRTQNDTIKTGMLEDKKTPQATGQDWIIIVGFIVGVAALVMLCVAIATRDKWNGPSQASQLETNTNSSNQQRELEMETFLHKDNPKENGKAAEYTVIPLDELSESYSSH